MTSLEISEHASSHYAPRTWVNATSASLTVAFAMDFSSAGEKLTHKAAGGKYVALDLLWPALVSAKVLYQAMRHHGTTLNIAGNGLHTLSKHGWRQEAVDRHVFNVLKLCHQHLPISSIRSGGQTGVDEAGLISAMALNIPATALLPRGYRQRSAMGIDMSNDPMVLRSQWQQRATQLDNAE